MRTYSIPFIALHIVVACSVVAAAPSSSTTKDVSHADGIGMTFMSIWSDGTAIAGNVLAEDLQRALPWDPDRDGSGIPVPINLALHLSRQFLKSAFPADKWSLSKLELRERSDYWFYLLHFRRGNTNDLLRVPVLFTGAVAPMEINPEREVD